MDLHVGKMAEQVKYLVQHLRNNDSLGRRIKISVEVSQLESGMTMPIWKKGCAEKLTYLKPTTIMDLMTELWEMLAEISFTHWLPGGDRSII